MPSGEIHWFAMKCVDKRTVVQHGAEQQIMNELKLITKLNHPLIIGLSATFKVCGETRASALYSVRVDAF